MAVSAVCCLAYQAHISIPLMWSMTFPSTSASACCIQFLICFLSVRLRDLPLCTFLSTQCSVCCLTRMTV